MRASGVNCRPPGAFELVTRWCRPGLSSHHDLPWFPLGRPDPLSPVSQHSGHEPLTRTTPVSGWGGAEDGAVSCEGAEGWKCPLGFKPSFQDGQRKEGIISLSFLPAQEKPQFFRVVGFSF